jgi:hypothetical protein
MQSPCGDHHPTRDGPGRTQLQRLEARMLWNGAVTISPVRGEITWILVGNYRGSRYCLPYRRGVFNVTN